MPYTLDDRSMDFADFFGSIIDYFATVPTIMGDIYALFPSGITDFFFMTFALTFGFAFLIKIIRILL